MAREAYKHSGEACKRCRFGIHPNKEAFMPRFPRSEPEIAALALLVVSSPANGPAG